MYGRADNSTARPRSLSYGEPVTESDSKPDIEKPSIDDVKWFGKEITVLWSAARGATQHILIVFDKENNLAIEPKTLKHPTTNLRMTDACNYGKTCKFVIEASCEKQKETAEKCVLIGGDKAVTELVAKQDVANPRRAILVEWEPPKKPPQGYRLILYDRGNENKAMKDEVTPIEASQKTHRFVELKTETQYCVSVCPIYNGDISDGTLSNVIKTGKRIKHANEQENGFGKTEKIIHAALKAVSADQTTIELSWSSVQMGENYKVTGYEVYIYQKGWVTNTAILKKTVDPKTTTIVADLKKGLKYEVKVSTLHFDLDTAEKGETTKDYEIVTDPSKTIINDCELGEGVVFFTWQSVNGAKKYQLVIKDEYFIKSLVPDFFRDVTGPGKECSAKIQLSGELQIGRSCMTKVFVHAEGGGISETDWKAHLLGGDTVPRNVEVTRSSENPKRAVNITFDCPKKGPAREYKIVAFPESGMKKIVYSKTSNAVVEYLRKGITYHFEVYAKWETGWSKGSPSNLVRMEGDKGKSLMDIHNIKGTNIDLTNAILAGQSTEIIVSSGKDFGQVEDLRVVSKRIRDKDSITLHWNSPSFKNKVSDFKVEIYKVEVWEQHESEGWTEVVDFEKHRREYYSKEFKLDLGKTYKFAVSTIFLDIDQDYIYKSIAVQEQFHTRPCAPRCIRNDYTDDTLTIEWNAAKGAQRYEVELYVDNDSEPAFRRDMEKNTIYRREFDEIFGYGSTYHVVIKAFGVENISNSQKTCEKIIGGDRVATNVSVTSNHPRVTDPNSEVFLSWTAPECAPKRYDISSFPAAETMKANITGDECLVYGLKAGTEYYFKVKAVHKLKGKEKFSGGSNSKKIRTNPTPTQVKKIWADPGQNPSTSVEISWEKVGVEKENETTKYRVCLVKEDETTKREVTDVEAETVILQDLEPGSTYFVSVAGGNSMGYGIDSEKVQFKTDIGTPKNVQLLNNKRSLSTSLILEFSKAEGQVFKYVAILHLCRNQIEQPMPEVQEVESGHTYNDLEPNTEYLVKLQAVFDSGEGKAVKSRRAMTASSQTKIVEYGRIVQNGYSSSRKIYAAWSPDVGCNCHEVKVICGASTVENHLLKNENNFRYSCLNEATQYSIQVRSRNGSGHFGEWSDEAVIYLAPAKLQQVSAYLDKNGYDILIQCRAALTHSPSYFMRALRGCEPVGQAICAKEEYNIVKWKFAPPESAQRYSFELWAEDFGKIKGKRVLSNPVISWPPKFTFTMVRTFLSTDIEMAWENQERCDSYEITICAHDQQMPENVVKTAKTSCWYRCKSPGNTYILSIRAIREHVKGDWSDDQHITLAPGKIHILEPTEVKKHVNKSKTIKIEWKPLDITPKGYLINLFCNGKAVDAIKTKTTNHVFERKLKPGSLCYCTVAAFNDEDCRRMGEESKSRIYRIEWAKASYIRITADENEPSQTAKMNWDKPPGVNCFKLEIENNLTGVVTTTCLTENKYVFESGIPGNTYSVRLHCGCDDRYDVDYIQQTLTMKPKPPTDIRVYANDQVKGLIIEFKDTPSGRKHYEITAHGLTDSTPKIRKTTSHSLQLCGLVSGESYKVAVSTIIGESRSIEARSEGYISTFPDGVRNLRSKMDKGIILFEWDALEIKPSKYIVEWRVDNEAITEEHTQETSIRIDILKPVEYYRVRVKAENGSGVGPMSEWEHFKTGVLTSPEFVQAKKIINPENLKLIKHGDMEIWYDPNKPLRFGSNVFATERKGADGVEELVLKIVPGITETNRREVKNLKMVTRHENIVKYYASGFCEFRGSEAIYLLMEKCDHDTVWERFLSKKQLKNGEHKKPVAFTRCKFEMRSTGEAIQYIHGLHIVHRDLKPHNLLIKDGVLVISDFGLSKMIPNSKSNTSQSQPDIGTDGWRAPETGDDNAKTTKASDIYSYGLVSYYMLTNGKHPYGGDPRKWHTYIVDDVDGSKMCLDGLDSLPDAPLSKDLIGSMLVRKLEQRPTIAEVLFHPFFWDSQRKFAYISDVCKYLELVTKLEQKPAQTEKASLMSYLSLDSDDGKYAEEVDMTNWKEKLILDEEELRELRNKAEVSKQKDIQKDCIQKKVKKKARDCVSDAIKFIRNRYTHDHEDKSENIDMTNEELWEFFNKRFPYLFLFVYHKMKVYFTGKSTDDKDFTSTMSRYFVR